MHFFICRYMFSSLCCPFFILSMICLWQLSCYNLKHFSEETQDVRLAVSVVSGLDVGTKQDGGRGVGTPTSVSFPLLVCSAKVKGACRYSTFNALRLKRFPLFCALCCRPIPRGSTVLLPSQIVPCNCFNTELYLHALNYGQC